MHHSRSVPTFVLSIHFTHLDSNGTDFLWTITRSSTIQQDSDTLTTVTWLINECHSELSVMMRTSCCDSNRRPISRARRRDAAHHVEKSINQPNGWTVPRTWRALMDHQRHYDKKLISDRNAVKPAGPPTNAPHLVMVTRAVRLQASDRHLDWYIDACLFAVSHEM